MKYLTLETNSLVDLVGRKENKIDWESIGTNAKSINLSPINNTVANVETKGTIYLLPITDEKKTNNFIIECAKHEIEAKLITVDKAKSILVANKEVVVAQ